MNATTRLVSLKAANGRLIRRATCIEIRSGNILTSITFTERMSRRNAIKQAADMYEREGRWSPAFIHSLRQLS